MSRNHRQDAMDARDKLRASGFEADVYSIPEGGKIYYLVNATLGEVHEANSTVSARFTKSKRTVADVVGDDRLKKR